MTSAFSIWGSVLALLLLAVLAAGASFEYITTAECARARPPDSMWIRIRHYPVDTVGTWLSMHTCNLTQINLEDLAGLPKLEFIILSTNKLREVPVFEDGSCPSLTSLFLYKNQLTKIKNEGTFSPCVKLKIIDLGYNQIEFIHINAFRSLTDLQSLDLSHNLITFISNEMFMSNRKLDYLDLNNNRITQLPTKFVSRLKDAGTGMAKFWFYDNPWHCACLLELLRDVRKTGVRNYADWNYTGDMPVCVYRQTKKSIASPRTTNSSV